MQTYYDRLPNPLKSVLPLIGFGALAYASLQTLFGIANSITKLPKKNLARTYGKGSWALVTGASEGIGKAFCEELVRDGFNVILISRSLEKLQKAVADLRKIREDVQTKVITADFVKVHEERFFENLANEIEDFDVSILINCVGLEQMNNFEEIDPQFMKDLATANTIPVVLMSRMMVKKFKNRETKKGERCAIINVSSISGLRPVPFFNPYGPSKAFTAYFSRALAEEVDNSNIDVVSLAPGYVQTALTARKPLGIDTITANNCARGILDKLGNVVQSCGHWKHRLVAAKATGFPEFISDLIIRPVMKKEMMRRKEAHGNGGH